ncbi:alcohol dehydrogenase family protein [Curtobacterium pusillum]|jgi:NADPH:quinone reductase-like Zn-dependent oxidoreductase|uniref:NADPH:quinone reductase-like Zn-dependent oxidoreductase n=2 Tax=Curtobacterium pusillum TaxID=69373 RepID=A0AAW3TEL0_9MICO|nr:MULTISPECIES: zinc-binding dehydrogenase [Curtobacterium]MBA8992088.1 NADPH:quinone reductase-like Zn-dependent oxidoreductase [Curtobacterium pusillum]GLK32300.1 alcohol dehydrogenase [Curtobacterium pusillum]
MTELQTMRAVVTTGIGGPEMVQVTQVPVPPVGSEEVLIRVSAAGVNNTDINTRLGWYSRDVRSGTADAHPISAKQPGGYNGATVFPLIQGADGCGTVVAVGAGVAPTLQGRRVLVRSCMLTQRRNGVPLWFGSDRDGAFAEYTVVPAAETFPVDSNWTDVELASIPCSSGTAENMVERTGIGRGSRVLVTGAAGGVGSAAVQLALRRGADVVAVASASKHAPLRDLGVTDVIDRDADLIEALGDLRVDVVIDNVAGPGFSSVLEALVSGGTYVTSGAIAGPIVELDLRRLYLRDIRLVGTTSWADDVFPQVISAIEHDELRPLVAETFPLDQIADAQRAFQRPGRFGNIVLTVRHHHP